MQTVYILCGLIGSGKSTWAKEKAAAEEQTIIINRDALRTMIKDAYVFNQLYEPYLKKITSVHVGMALEDAFDIIIDETHLTRKKRSEWVELVNIFNSRGRGHKAKIVIVYFSEKENNLKNRMANSRGISQDVWENVLENMKNNFEIPLIDELPEGGEILEIKI
jgi:predicted kinase